MRLWRLHTATTFSLCNTFNDFKHECPNKCKIQLAKALIKSLQSLYLIKLWLLKHIRKTCKLWIDYTQMKFASNWNIVLIKLLQILSISVWRCLKMKKMDSHCTTATSWNNASQWIPTANILHRQSHDAVKISIQSSINIKHQ